MLLPNHREDATTGLSSPLGLREPREAAAFVPQTESTEARPAPPAARKRRRSWIQLSAIALLTAGALAGVGIVSGRALTQPPAVTVAEGIVVVETNPPGAELFIGGRRRGVSPLRLTLPPGTYDAELRAGSSSRMLPVTVQAGIQSAYHIDMIGVLSVGSMHVQSEPSGANVHVDGALRGVTPLQLSDLPTGSHDVLVENGTASARHTVNLEPGATVSLMTSLSGSVNGAGWIRAELPFTTDIFENGRLIGTSLTDRIMLPAGRHRVELVNEGMAFRNAYDITVRPGRTTLVRPELPRGTLYANALPWAEVWIDGQRVGETPLANVSVTIGSHEVVFRHPQLGERRAAVTVRASGVTRASADFRQ
jgi:hypothetical protein